MIQIVKNLLSLILPVLSLMPVLFSACFTVQLKIARQEAMEKLEKSMLQTIRLQKKDFTWEKKGKEIRINGKFFDIKSIRKEKGVYVITGIYDEQEDLLHRQLLTTQNKQGNSSQNKLCNFFFHGYYLLPAPLEEGPALPPTKNHHAEYYLAEFPFPYFNIVSPPPDFV